MASFLLHPFFVLLLSLLMHPISGNVELRALMQLKSSLDPQSSLLSSWSREGDPCRGDFEGVACNEVGKVVNISLQGKGLSGFISPSVAQLKCLTGLYLHYNAISGRIPSEIASLTELVDLYLNVNSLSGEIPEEIGSMASLQVLQLCCNKLTGSIPTRLGLLKKLSVLALQSNHLTGTVPASLGDLSQLSRLELSFNNLFGSIPTKLAQLPYLQLLDLQNNSLSGNVPSDLKKLGDGFQYANNLDLCGSGFSSLRLCTSADLIDIPLSANPNLTCDEPHCSKFSKFPAAAVAAAVSATVIVIGLLVFARYKLSGSSEALEHKLSVEDNAKSSFRMSASPLISLEYSHVWDPLADERSGIGFRFNVEEVESATQYFSEVNLLERSNFASSYKGILRDGTVVAVKCISKMSCKTEEGEFLKGLKMLTLLHHENIVGLRGFCCSRGRGKCYLVYDFVNSGKLSGYLDVNGGESWRVFQWPARVSIIKGIVKGIEYLHSNRTNKPSLIHQNLSADEIHIDCHFNPLLSTCGLHNLLADDIIFSTLKSSAANGYLAPEYATVGRFSTETDVYAFGVILFQILTGKKRIAQLRLVAEAGNVEELIDENLKGEFNLQEAAKFVKMALLCTSEDPKQRPTMEILLHHIC